MLLTGFPPELSLRLSHTHTLLSLQAVANSCSFTGSTWHATWHEYRIARLASHKETQDLYDAHTCERKQKDNALF